MKGEADEIRNKQKRLSIPFNVVLDLIFLVFLTSLRRFAFTFLSLAKNFFVSLRPKKARFALSPWQRPVVLVQIGKLRPVRAKALT